MLSYELQEIVEQLDKFAEAYPKKWLLQIESLHPYQQHLLKLHQQAFKVCERADPFNRTSPYVQAIRTIVGATQQEEYYAVMTAQKYAFSARSERPGVETKQREIISDMTLFTLGQPNRFQEPSMLPWLTETVANLAKIAYRERNLPSAQLDNDRLFILADALEDAGYEEVVLLSHLRSPRVHVRGCWALDSLLRQLEEMGR